MEEAFGEAGMVRSRSLLYNLMQRLQENKRLLGCHSMDVWSSSLSFQQLGLC